MDDKELRLSSWLVSSRPTLRTVGRVAFLLADFLLVLVAIVLGVQYALSAKAEERLITSLAENRVQYASVDPRLQPAPLVVTKTAILGGQNQAYDLVAVAHNPSTRWAVESVDYAFVLDRKVLAHGSASFFPDEERYLAQFKVLLASVSPQADLSVTFSNIRWKRIRAVSDLPAITLTVAQPAYHLLSSVPSSPLSQVTGTVTNSAVFALPSVEVTALLMNAGTIIGVGQLVLSDVLPSEERPIDLRLYQVLNVDAVLLEATVNLSDYSSAT
ncbi:MAG: hypothetical protein V1778_03945 [bacterium]